MTTKLEEVKKSELAVGDIINVSFKSDFSEGLYLNEKVVAVEETYVETEDRGFLRVHSRFYIVVKAKRDLPTEIGSVVKHNEGWQFIRLAEDSWIGLDPEGVIFTNTRWNDAEVSNDGNSWEQIS